MLVNRQMGALQMNDGPELSDVIAALRANLATAQNEGASQNLRFNIDDVEIELQVAVTKERSGSGGIKFWVVDAKAEGKFTDAITQKIKLRMKVVDTDPKVDQAEAPNAQISSPGRRPVS
jgi:Trypsin-co-occurring domain 2